LKFRLVMFTEIPLVSEVSRDLRSRSKEFSSSKFHLGSIPILKGTLSYVCVQSGVRVQAEVLLTVREA
jgi:hypothetical protein